MRRFKVLTTFVLKEFVLWKRFTGKMIWLLLSNVQQLMMRRQLLLYLDEVRLRLDGQLPVL